MTLFQGSQALAVYLRANWSGTRDGRPDIPDHIRDDAGDPTTSFNAATGPGVVILADRQDQVSVDRALFDPIYVYHPEADPPTTQDTGYASERQEENIQIDIELTDRNDPDTGTRLNARNRMLGNRYDEQTGDGGRLNTETGFSVGGNSGATLGEDERPSEIGPYPGVVGEVKYLLERTRRGLDEWDVARADPVNVYLGNSNANISYRVTLEKIGTNTTDIR